VCPMCVHDASTVGYRILVHRLFTDHLVSHIFFPNKATGTAREISPEYAKIFFAIDIDLPDVFSVV
jgi:hypothetical protein